MKVIAMSAESDARTPKRIGNILKINIVAKVESKTLKRPLRVAPLLRV